MIQKAKVEQHHAAKPLKHKLIAQCHFSKNTGFIDLTAINTYKRGEKTVFFLI